MQDVYKNMERYNPSRKCNVLLFFDNIIADVISNKKLSSVVTELFLREKKLNVSTVFITQSYFQVSRDIRIICTHFFIEHFKQTKCSTNRI